MHAVTLFHATKATFHEFTPIQVQVLQALLLSADHSSSAGQLQTLLGLTAVVQVNAAIGQAGRKVYKALGRHPDGIEDGHFEWWHMLATGKHSVRNGFVWTLRPEVSAALEDCGLRSAGQQMAEELGPQELSSYLFLWNPNKDTRSFRGYEQVVADASVGKSYVTRWICPSQRPRPGDIAYMQRTGPKNNGVFARGVVTQGAHSQDDGMQVVCLSLDEFLPVGSELSRARIIAHSDYTSTWSPMASGNVIPERILAAIETLWPPSTTIEPIPLIDTDAFDVEELVGLEGEVLHRMIRHHKRERYLRDRKIADVLGSRGSLACQVPGCGFDFARAYGTLGEGYAHVHHLLPLAQRDSAQPTSLSDLAVVCANCHAMIHRGGESRELGSLIGSRKESGSP
ncbi:HNH endonuclease [Rhodoferax sp.]|uniref:HNH endonuclease n=1 Tax=Rhodoferax sp. TaxID=50421 RepID=UPI002769D19E|nr:HNH endonuclease [Rhodoferax sp.]